VPPAAANAPQSASQHAPAQAAEVVPVPARGFINRLWTDAREASQATGIPAHFMIAQAALETGWGRSELRFSDGTPTYNVFGIKAGRGWQGAVAEATTTEYVNGVAQRSVERFRAYGSYAEAFRDYANLLTTNPRYAGVLNRQDAAGFARGLQQAGYATDPMYAAKLERIIGGQALRSGMIG
jgi:flagellar protein FlgJ